MTPAPEPSPGEFGIGERLSRDAQLWRSLSPRISQLQDHVDGAATQFAELAVVADAEGTVTKVRQEDLLQAQKHAWRRVSAARGRLTRAQRGGDPETIRAARQRMDQLYAEACNLAETGIGEMRDILGAGLDRTQALLDTAAEVFTTQRDVTEAIQNHRPDGDLRP